MKALENIIGCYLFILNDREELHRQGRIIGKEGDLYIIQLHSWYDGSKTRLEFLPLTAIRDVKKALLFATYAAFSREFNKRLSLCELMPRQSKIHAPRP